MIMKEDHQRVHLSNQFGLPFSSGGRVLIQYRRSSSRRRISSENGMEMMPKCMKMLSRDPKTMLMG